MNFAEWILGQIECLAWEGNEYIDTVFDFEFRNICRTKTSWIKSVSWEYICDEEHLEELNKGKIKKYSLILAVLSRTRLDPASLSFYSNSFVSIHNPLSKQWFLSN